MRFVNATFEKLLSQPIFQEISSRHPDPSEKKAQWSLHPIGSSLIVRDSVGSTLMDTSLLMSFGISLCVFLGCACVKHLHQSISHCILGNRGVFWSNGL